MSEYHTPVMLDESVSYADATFGGGGHTAELLSRLHDGARVIAFDRDRDAVRNAPDDPRLTMVHNNFRFIENYARHLDVRFDGILADLGVSSHQFDTADRGFSFRFEEAPLDMRMNAEGKLTAAEIVNTYSAEDLERILRLSPATSRRSAPPATWTAPSPASSPRERSTRSSPRSIRPSASR